MVDLNTCFTRSIGTTLCLRVVDVRTCYYLCYQILSCMLSIEKEALYCPLLCYAPATLMTCKVPLAWRLSAHTNA